MKYRYTGSTIPCKKEVYMQINAAAARLSVKLKKLDLSQLNISDYNRNYLQKDHLTVLTRTLQKYAFILASSLSPIKKPYDEITFLEYGGGVGMLSLLAAEAGIGIVIYNDIYDVSCSDAKAIATALEIPAQHYICGDIDEVITYLKERNLNCSAMASYDVIEHVYDIDEFLKKIAAIPSEEIFSLYMSSGANGLNSRIKKSLCKHHHSHEYEDRPNEWGHKQRDCLQSFFNVRKQIIEEYAPLLALHEVTKLAKATRGKIKKDIIKVVDRYNKTKLIPAVPTFSDTCDPYTGNWSEHLMDPYHLSNVLKDVGFDSRVVCGYYGAQNNTLKNCVSTVLNFSISHLPTGLGLRVAPFYTLAGVRRERAV